MKKLLFILTVMLVALGIVFPAAAQTGDVTGMAQYFPANTLVYGVTRSDDAFVDELDALFQHVAAFVPDVPAGISLKEMLYNAPFSQPAAGLTVGESIRPWLGDAMAFGIIGPFDQWLNNRQPPMVGAIAVTDRAAAEKFLEDLVAATDPDMTVFEKSEEGDFTIWQIPYIAVAIGDSVMYFAPAVEVLPLNIDGSLAGNKTFQQAVDAMPLDSYDMFAYVDVVTLGSEAMTMAQASGSEESQAAMDMMALFMKAYGPAVVGITMLDEQTLAMDFVESWGDTSGLEDIGLTMNTATTPVNLDFAANIPADAALVMMGTDAGSQISTSLANMRALGKYLKENDVMPQMDGGYGYGYSNMMANMNLADVVNFMEFGFAGMTGLNLQNDVLAWMGGGYAGYVRALPSDTLPMTVDFAGMTETSDADATQNVVDHLAKAFDQYQLTYSKEGNGPRSILALTELADMAFPPNFPFAVADATELDVLVGTNGSLFVMGTRPGAEYSLNPDGPGLAEDATFTHATSYFLPDSSAVMYVNLTPLYPVFQEFAQKMDASEREMREIEQAVSVLSVIESASLSGRSDTTSSSARLVISLADAPK